MTLCGLQQQQKIGSNDVDEFHNNTKSRINSHGRLQGPWSRGTAETRSNVCPACENLSHAGAGAGASSPKESILGARKKQQLSHAVLMEKQMGEICAGLTLPCSLCTALGWQGTRREMSGRAPADGLTFRVKKSRAENMFCFKETLKISNKFGGLSCRPRLFVGNV